MIFDLPTLYTIGVKKVVEGPVDAHGNTTEEYSQVINLPVYSIYPSTSGEPFESGRHSVETDLTVLAPAGTALNASDIVVIDGEEYTVEGNVADWSRNPFEFKAATSISLKRVEG